MFSYSVKLVKSGNWGDMPVFYIHLAKQGYENVGSENFIIGYFPNFNLFFFINFSFL